MVTNEPVHKYGQFRFPLPRWPRIRIWASREVYPDGMYVKAADSNGHLDTPQMKFPLQMVPDDSTNWTTATEGDFIFQRGGTASSPAKGWIYLTPGIYSPKDPVPDPKYTIYVYDDGKELETKFGLYQGIEQEPKPFPDDGENYFWEMSDIYGNWLWLYRLYAPEPRPEAV